MVSVDAKHHVYLLYTDGTNAATMSPESSIISVGWYNVAGTDFFTQLSCMSAFVSFQ